MSASQRRPNLGFTLLELLTVIVVIAILATMLIPAMGALRDHADRGGCASNLKSLYVAAGAYLGDKGEWPQIATVGVGTSEHANLWIRAFEPYGLGQINWVCPTVRRKLGLPSKQTDARIDYLATPFDAMAMTPYKWSTQPWFIEASNAHGDGNLLIFSTGEVKSLNEMLKGKKR